MPFKCNEPAVPTIQQEDSTVRITRWDFAPGAATGWHTHGWPYFVVMLTDAVMKIEAPDGVRGAAEGRGILSAARRRRARRVERLGTPDGVRRDRDQAAGSVGTDEVIYIIARCRPAAAFHVRFGSKADITFRSDECPLYLHS
jgi:hypothetical protein